MKNFWYKSLNILGSLIVLASMMSNHFFDVNNVFEYRCEGQTLHIEKNGNFEGSVELGKQFEIVNTKKKLIIDGAVLGGAGIAAGIASHATGVNGYVAAGAAAKAMGMAAAGEGVAGAATAGAAGILGIGVVPIVGWLALGTGVLVA